MRKYTPNPITGSARERGFTLIEMLIVGSLIALFSGIAMFGIQQMYDSNREKIMRAEASELGTALSFAHDDLGFFPRLDLLSLPKPLLVFEQTGQATYLRPSVDNYGADGITGPQVNNLSENWKGPYLGMAETRKRSHGIVKMRLSDPLSPNFQAPDGIGDVSLVDWPSDTWGNPYVLYQVTIDPAFKTGTNQLGLRLIANPTESANYFNAVVSYGPNKVPGGNENSTGDIATALFGAALYVKGDIGGSNQAQFTLKSIYASDSALQLASTDFIQRLANSLENPNTTDPAFSGILEDGSDDIIFRF